MERCWHMRVVPVCVTMIGRPFGGKHGWRIPCAGCSLVGRCWRRWGRVRLDRMAGLVE